LDLNQTWTVDDWDAKGEYSVQISGFEAPVPPERVVLEGGELLDLVFVRKNRRLEHQRFNYQLLTQKPHLLDPLDRTQSYFVGGHLPRRAGGSEVEFPVSVQNDVAHQFSRRPRHIWAEIRALPTRSRVFYVCDPEFEVERPVPVIRCRVSPWPQESLQAEIQLWFNFTPDAQGREFELDLSQPSRLDLDGVTLEIEPNPGAEGELYRIVITEQHTQQSSVYPLLVQLRPQADYVSRGYFEATRKVRHLMAYKDRLFWREESPRLIVTPVRQPGVLSQWVSSGPMVVDLPRR
jgi:hypothetical protein